MRQLIVRYRLRADRVAENEALVHRVYDELARTAPDGIAYGTFKLADEVTWMHIAFVAGDANPLLALAAFKAFGAQIAARCDEPPVVTELTCVDAYRLPGVASAPGISDTSR